MKCFDEVSFLFECFPIQVHIINLQVLRQFFIQNFIDHILVLVRHDKFPFFAFLSQIDASYGIRIAF